MKSILMILIAGFAFTQAAMAGDPSPSPWCARNSVADQAQFGEFALSCPEGWVCSNRRVSHADISNHYANNDPSQSFWQDEACGKGGDDDAICPRYCHKK